jgi:hypothetical protein
MTRQNLFIEAKIFCFAFAWLPHSAEAAFANV